MKPLSDQKYLQNVIESLGYVDSIDIRRFHWKLLIFFNNFSFFGINCVLLISEFLAYKDFFALCDEMSQSFTVQLSFVKLFYFTWNERYYKEMREKIETTRRKYASAEAFEQAMIRSRRLGPLISVFYIICVRITSVGFMMLAVIIGLYTTYATEYPTWGLPIKVHPIFLPTKLVPYILSYAWHVHICYTVAGGAITMECLAIEFQIKITALLKILQSQYRNLSGCGGTYRTTKHFRDVVNFHQEIIELVNDLSTLYQPIIFAQFVVTAVAVCVIGFLLLLGRSNLIETFILVAFAMGILFEPLIYAYSGEMIMEESVKVGDAVYQSDWIDMTANDRQLLVLCILRAQRPLKLQSPFYEINLFTFARIINATFSYITLLRTVMIE